MLTPIPTDGSRKASSDGDHDLSGLRSRQPHAEAAMGFRLRKSINIAPGVRLNFSKSGIGYSVGVKGYRVTHQVDGRTRRTASLPGTGLSYVTTSGRARPRAQSRPVALEPAPPVAKPGWFAPSGEKELYRAFEARDATAAAAVATEHPALALAASTI